MALSTRLVRCKATIMSVDAQNVLALADSFSLRVTSETIDVSGPMDTWKVLEECGSKQWEIQIEKLISSTVKGVLLDIIVDGGAIVVSSDAAEGHTFYAVGVSTGFQGNWADPNKESLTITGIGIAPIIT